MLRLADVFFVLFHSALVIFNTTGYLIPRLRRANLAALALTALSWFGLGLFYGIGYCPLTDWHWQILIAAGETDLPRSYIQYLIQRLFGIPLDARLVDIGVGVAFGVSVVASVALNVRNRRR